MWEIAPSNPSRIDARGRKAPAHQYTIVALACMHALGTSVRPSLYIVYIQYITPLAVDQYAQHAYEMVERPSVCPCVCLSHHSITAAACGGFAVIMLAPAQVASHFRHAITRLDFLLIFAAIYFRPICSDRQSTRLLFLDLSCLDAVKK